MGIREKLVPTHFVAHTGCTVMDGAEVTVNAAPEEVVEPHELVTTTV